MKKISIYLLMVLLSIRSLPVFAQVVIDLSTGMSNLSNTPLSTTSNDDTWSVSWQPWAGNLVPPPLYAPPPSVYQSALVCNGTQHYYGCSGSLIYTQTSPQPGGFMYITHKRDPSGFAVSDFRTNYLDGGYFYYKMSFEYGCPDVETCSMPYNVSSAIMNLEFFQANNFNISPYNVNPPSTDGRQDWMAIVVNGHPHLSPFLNVPPPGPPVGPLLNYSIPISATEIVPGLNEIIIVIREQFFGCSISLSGIIEPQMLGIKGNLTINTYNDLKDANGNAKNEFCLDEDVFLDGSSTIPKDGYKLELYYNNALLVTPQTFAGKPYLVNLTEAFRNLLPMNFFSSNITGTYKVVLTVEDPCDPDKTLQTVKEFKYKCCPNSLDGSFSLAVRKSKLEVKSKAKGFHEWNIYSAGNANTGPYTYVQTVANPPKFSIPLSLEDPNCYYVSHKLKNACGEVCVSQGSCRLSCDVTECILGIPHAPFYNPGTGQLSWQTVPGATSYLIETIVNGCCGDQGGTSASQYSSFTTNSNPSPLPLGSGGMVGECYLVKVYALCEDGTRSTASTLCIGGSGGRAGNVMSVAENTGAGLVEIYPNPTEGMVSIDLKTPLEGEYNISVFDRTGKMVKRFDNPPIRKDVTSLAWNTESMTKGIYLVKIVMPDNQIVTRKLIIEE